MQGMMNFRREGEGGIVLMFFESLVFATVVGLFTHSILLAFISFVAAFIFFFIPVLNVLFSLFLSGVYGLSSGIILSFGSGAEIGAGVGILVFLVAM